MPSEISTFLAHAKAAPMIKVVARPLDTRMTCSRQACVHILYHLEHDYEAQKAYSRYAYTIGAGRENSFRYHTVLFGWMCMKSHHALRTRRPKCSCHRCNTRPSTLWRSYHTTRFDSRNLVMLIILGFDQKLGKAYKQDPCTRSGQKATWYTSIFHVFQEGFQTGETSTV